MWKYFEKFINLVDIVEKNTTSKKQIKRIINFVLLIDIILIILLFATILCNIKNTSLYPPFIVLISILIAIFALKINIRDKEIDYHDKKVKDIKTNLHILISYLNILKNMQDYIGKIYTGESTIEKYQLIRTQKKYEEILSKIYDKESLVYLNPEDVIKLENIQMKAIMFNGEIDLFISKLPDNFIGKIPEINAKSRKDFNLEILNNIKKLQDSLIEIVNKNYEPYQQIIDEENK
ncbi:hypothetical protein [Arcobacter aquimarinus]|uniref:Membrane protein n=1 Tax=Arcobacter aquimarinus TaxID=1315211 RepID=A0AAE7B232_9BACT|nr:hypothetical protein [Arcobacter aquimarinus]QKE26083.1 putative membrane protein [Arcobacter aquimarinus]RXI36195.1 hypothetical protein CP986_02910 [Arcobacter aquimarinus]